MGFFSNKKKYLFEAEDDNTASEPTTGSDAGTADTQAADTSTDSDQSTDNNTEDNADQNNDNQDTNDDGFGDEDTDNQDDDFSIDSDPDPDDSGDDSGSDDSSSSSSSSDSDEEDTVKSDSLKAKDKELFDSLTPAEQKLKLKSLKQLFVDMYSNCDNIIEKFNSLAAEYDEANDQIDRIVGTLYGLRKMISDYLLNKFDTSSYIENDIMFNNYLAILNSIKNISEDIKNIYKDDSSDS